MNVVNSEIKNHFLEVKLNRPDMRNAFNPEMISELKNIFNKANDQNIRGVLLSGEGKSFCSGADLGWMQSMVNYSMDQNIADSKELFDMFIAADNCEVPIITKVHGHVFGGALGLLAVSDIVAAHESTQFAFSEVKLGLAPAVISPFVLKKMHSNYSYQYMLTGERFKALEAKGCGLVHYVNTTDSIDEYIEHIKHQFLQNGPEAVRATKKLLKTSRYLSLKEAREPCSQVIAQRRVSKEGQEGLAGFLQKKPVSWDLGKG